MDELEESLGAGLEEAARLIQDRLEAKVRRMMDRVEAERDLQRTADHEEYRGVMSRLESDIDELRQRCARGSPDSCCLEVSDTSEALDKVIRLLEGELGPLSAKANEMAKRNCYLIGVLRNDLQSLQGSLDEKFCVLRTLHDEQVRRMSDVNRDIVTAFGKVISELRQEMRLPLKLLPAELAVFLDSDVDGQLAPRVLEVKAAEPPLNDIEFVSRSFLRSPRLEPSERQLSAERLSISASSPTAATPLHDCINPVLTHTPSGFLQEVASKGRDEEQRPNCLVKSVRPSVEECSPGALMRSSCNARSLCKLQADGDCNDCLCKVGEDVSHGPDGDNTGAPMWML